MSGIFTSCNGANVDDSRPFPQIGMTCFDQKQRKQSIRMHDPVEHGRIDPVQCVHRSIRCVVDDDVNVAVGEIDGVGDDLAGRFLSLSRVGLHGESPAAGVSDR